MSKKLELDTESVRKILFDRGYELIGDEEYINTKSKFRFKDNYGYYYYAIIGNIILGQDPSKYHLSNPYTMQNINLFISDKPFKMLSNTYQGQGHKYELECYKIGCGETFQMSWTKLSLDQGCPYCAGRKVGLSNCLATKLPDILKQWHATLNAELTPYSVTVNSNKKVWWQCDKDETHSWEAAIYDRTLGSGCPYCSGHKVLPSDSISIHFPEVARQWHNELNGNLTPFDVSISSNLKVWWSCDNITHKPWKAVIAKRTSRNQGCPSCSGRLATSTNNLLANYPEVAIEWHQDQNKRSTEDYTPKSGAKVWWKCSVDESHDPWESAIVDRTAGGSGCPNCSESEGEKKIREYLKNKNKKYIRQIKYAGLVGEGSGRLSYDFYLINYNLLIEYQGEYHDGTVPNQPLEMYNRQKEHDRRKKQYAIDNNIKLLEIWYWDFDNIEKILYDYLEEIKSLAT